MEYNFRKSTIDTLFNIIVRGGYSNIEINHGMKEVEPRLENLYRKLVLGVLENMYFIDYALRKVSNMKLKRLDLDVFVSLRLAVYQIFFLDNSKDYIVVNETVEYVKEYIGLKESKYVNGVLRNIIRKRDFIEKSVEKLNFSDYLSVKYSYPVWMINKWMKQFGKDEIENVLDKNNAEANLNIRVNTEKIDRDELLSLLLSKEINAELSSIADKGIIINSMCNLDNLEEFQTGLFSIQSESSMLVGQVLDPKEGSFVVDTCAAPGSKTMDYAERVGKSGKIIARDIYEKKLELITNDSERLNLKNIKVEKYDASVIDEKNKAKADYVVVDAPCSGLGIIKRKPEIKFRRLEEDMKNFFNIQYNILLASSQMVKVGGELIYSTCTTNVDENQNIVRKFLKYNKKFEVVDISDKISDETMITEEGFALILPHVHEMDGFFIAKFKKNNM